MFQKVVVPDIGSKSDVDVIEVLVSPGDKISKDAPLITLENEKASMEIPCPFEGVVKSVHTKVGSKIREGDLIIELETTEVSKQQILTPDLGTPSKIQPEQQAPIQNKTKEEPKVASRTMEQGSSEPTVYAGPGTRQFARELGVTLSKVKGTGRKNRITKADVTLYVKNKMQGGGQDQGSLGIPMGIAEMPSIDHAQFGPIETKPLSRIKKFSGSNLHRNWIMIPHVTQFDEADITELEQFRQEQKSLAEKEGIRLTPLVFIMKAVVFGLQKFPIFNTSLDVTGENIIQKKYYHIGVAVDTPNGLVVPVIRDVDQKGLFQLSKEMMEISEKARKGQLTAKDMQGSCMSISSLGGIGGTQFTPIVNLPDVAILGVSKSRYQPIYQEGEFIPRLMLPIALSYNHRVIDGAEAVRFTTFLVQQLSDIRRLLL